MMPTVRLMGTNVPLATRRMSALVTLSIRSTVRNNSRQSSYRAWYIPSWSASPTLSASPRIKYAFARVLIVFKYPHLFAFYAVPLPGQTQQEAGDAIPANIAGIEPEHSSYHAMNTLKPCTQAH